MKKGDIYEGTVETVLFPNKGIVHIEEREIRIKNTLPGQRIRFQIMRKKSGRAEARVLEVLEASPLETVCAGCSLFPDCGGCMYRTLPYDTQLKLKQEQVRRLLEPVLTAEGTGCRWDDVFSGIYPSPSENAYRNKMEYSFGNREKDGPLTLGLHKRGGIYDVLSAEDCRIVHDDFNKILSCTQQTARESGIPFYHKRAHTGYFRHLLIRRAAATKEILIDLVTSSQTDAETEKVLLKQFVQKIQELSLEGTIAGILHTVNDSVADTIRDDHTDILFGRDFFYEEILGLRFKITPFSFFQTNSKGAEVLYETVRGMLGDVSSKVVFDLYSGTGTIAQMLAPAAKRAVGIEIVEEAVEAARQNASLNGLSNCEFLTGDVLKKLDEVTEKPDVIILDPPRDGIHPKALPKITAYGVDRIIYISCKPTSLARDLPWFLENGYAAEKICCVDMFPGTVHVETVCLLKNAF